jgi:hypothetical protein
LQTSFDKEELRCSFVHLLAANAIATNVTIDANVACDARDSLSNKLPPVVTCTADFSMIVPPLLAVAPSEPIGSHLSHDGHIDSTLTALVPAGHGPQLTVTTGGHSGVRMQSNEEHDGHPLGKNFGFDVSVMPDGHVGGATQGGSWHCAHLKTVQFSLQPERSGAVVELTRYVRSLHTGVGCGSQQGPLLSSGQGRNVGQFGHPFASRVIDPVACCEPSRHVCGGGHGLGKHSQVYLAHDGQPPDVWLVVTSCCPEPHVGGA